MVSFLALPPDVLTSRRLLDWLGRHVRRSAPLVEWLEGGVAQIKLNFATFANMINDSLYWKAF